MYADGYEDGRSSRYYAARGRILRVTKDMFRYDSDAEYRRGWNDGYAVAMRDHERQR